MHDPTVGGLNSGGFEVKRANMVPANQILKVTIYLKGFGKLRLWLCTCQCKIEYSALGRKVCAWYLELLSQAAGDSTDGQDHDQVDPLVIVCVDHFRDTERQTKARSASKTTSEKVFRTSCSHLQNLCRRCLRWNAPTLKVPTVGC